jgi:hypothetical protein
MNHTPYSPDLAPLRFLALSKIKKMPWRNKHLLAFLTSNATWKRYCEVFRKTTFKTVYGSGTVVSRSV